MQNTILCSCLVTKIIIRIQVINISWRLRVSADFERYNTKQEFKLLHGDMSQEEELDITTESYSQGRWEKTVFMDYLLPFGSKYFLCPYLKTEAVKRAALQFCFFTRMWSIIVHCEGGMEIEGAEEDICMHLQDRKTSVRNLHLNSSPNDNVMDELVARYTTYDQDMQYFRCEIKERNTC